MSMIVYGKTHTKKSYAKMRERNYVVQIRACSKSVLGVLKQGADYNFYLHQAVKPTCGHPYYSFLLYASVALAWTNKKPVKKTSFT